MAMPENNAITSTTLTTSCFIYQLALEPVLRLTTSDNSPAWIYAYS